MAAVSVSRVGLCCVCCHDNLKQRGSIFTKRRLLVQAVNRAYEMLGQKSPNDERKMRSSARDCDASRPPNAESWRICTTSIPRDPMNTAVFQLMLCFHLLQYDCGILPDSKHYPHGLLVLYQVGLLKHCR